MFTFKLLNSKERKRVLEQLEAQFGLDPSFLKKYAFLLQETKQRLYLANANIVEEDLESLRPDALGLYFGTLIPNNEIRLTIEGGQLLGPFATKNVLELDDEQFRHWIRGNALDLATEQRGFLLLKHNNDYCGCGKPVLDEKHGTVSLHNYIPKTRYVRSDD